MGTHLRTLNRHIDMVYIIMYSCSACHRDSSTGEIIAWEYEDDANEYLSESGIKDRFPYAFCIGISKEQYNKMNK